jgi:DNA-binding protein H-NS
VALKSMSIDKLMKLKSDIEAALAPKATEQRRALEAELSKLGGYQRGKKSSAGRAVAPKYRNPENPSETWAGRGLKPRWLAAAMKSGKSLDDFAIDASSGKGGRGKEGRRRRSSRVACFSRILRDLTGHRCHEKADGIDSCARRVPS